MSAQPFRALAPRGRPLAPIVLSAEDRAALEALERAPGTPRRLAQRARLVLRCAAGLKSCEVAAELGVSPQLVGRWRARFLEQGVDALRGAPHRGRPRRRDDALRQLEIALAAPPPRGRWTTRELAARCGVSQATITRLLRLRVLSQASALVPVALFVHGRDCVLALADVALEKSEERPLPAPLDGLPAPLDGLPAALDGLPAVLDGLPATLDGLPATLDGLPATLDGLRAHAARELRTRRGGVKLRRFLRQLVRRFPDRELMLVVAHADPPGRALRRWLDKHPRVHLHVLGAAHRWWALFAERWPSLPAGALGELPKGKPVSWVLDG